MKALLLPLAAVAVLAGCASHGDPYGHGCGQPGYGSANVQYQTAQDRRPNNPYRR